MTISSVDIHEVGPREGMQFEGIGDPSRIATGEKVRLVDALSGTGLSAIQVTSFVSPKAVPQMADADEITTAFSAAPGVTYDAVYLNDKGLLRAIDCGRYTIRGQVMLTASETFSVKNQRRTTAEDIEMQRKMAAVYAEHGYAIEQGMLMAAFGCNYEGDIPLQRVIDMTATLFDLAAERGSMLSEVMLADTMGWADPLQMQRTIGAVQDRWPDVDVSLHLHDTRGTAMANTWTAMQMGVRKFDTSIGGLGGCPFAKSVAGNVPTEDLAFMCDRMGIETGVDVAALVDCVRIAEEVVGHPLPSRVGHASLVAA